MKRCFSFLVCTTNYTSGKTLLLSDTFVFARETHNVHPRAAAFASKIAEDGEGETKDSQQWSVRAVLYGARLLVGAGGGGTVVKVFELCRAGAWRVEPRPAKLNVLLLCLSRLTRAAASDVD